MTWVYMTNNEIQLPFTIVANHSFQPFQLMRARGRETRPLVQETFQLHFIVFDFFGIAVGNILICKRNDLWHSMQMRNFSLET